jgi:metal-responsive CopG/Arc/MetJ family transcriptional regulator
MSRPKLKIEDKKGKLGISISKELIEKINLETNNKSTFIEALIKDYLKNKTNDL